MEDYLTVLESYETEIVVKKSRFLCCVFHVESEDNVGKILEECGKKHYKATHICFGYVLNTQPKRQKSSDNGEPSGTAGKPILDVINHRGLKDVLVVVIRYFGGVKLGTGGLIRAYGGGSSEVLNHAQTIKKQFSDQIKVVVSYSSYGGLSNGLLEKGIIPINEEFGENVILSFNISVTESSEFLKWIEDQTSGSAVITRSEPIFVDLEIN